MDKKLNNLLNFSDFIKNWNPEQQKKTKRTEIGLDIVKEGVSNIENYRYLNIEKLPNGLMIHLNDEGKEESEKLTEQNFYDLFEDVQGNSEYKYFDDIGEAGFGLTSAPGITDGYYFDDDGDLTSGDHTDAEVYWFPNYMVEDFTKTLIEEGKVFFVKAD